MIQRIKQKCVKLCLPLALSSCFLFQSCQNEALNELLVTILVTAANGWLVDDENMDDIPQDVDVVDVDENDLPSKVNLENKFPPIGDQGSYGTCVVWASGYNLKTALDGIDKNWTTEKLARVSYQTSPADLWYAIPSASKGTDCNGTNFEPALTALISSGAASLSQVPYSRVDASCSGTAKGNSSAKLANFRKIADGENQGMTVGNFKYYLSQGRPVVIGARLGDRFMAWNSSSVINYDTYVKEGMQHTYHAMVLSGYDDSKHAFRVRNSWGRAWGDNGSIWVDYDFFLSSFMFAAFVAQNENSVAVSENGIATADLTSGYDLLAYYAEDNVDPEGESELDRVFTYTIYNSGTRDIYASQKWRTIYMYYNASNADDYNIIYEDYYTNENGVEDEIGQLVSTDALCGGYWNYINAPAGKSVGDDYDIQYTMPKITGKYYLVVYADAYDAIAEGNEDNNFYFITAENAKPLEFVNGIIQNTMVKSLYKADKVPTAFENTKTQTTVRNGNLNAYTPNEIATLLHRDKKSGKLDAKIAQLKSSTNKAKKVRK